MLPAIKCGAILVFDAITTSDHCIIFLNIDITTSFHTSLPLLLKPPQRSLLSSNAQNCAKYITSLHYSLKQHKVFQRIQLLQRLSTPDLPQAILLAETIDQDVTRLMIASKKLHCPSLTPFLSDLAQACVCVSLLKLGYYKLKYYKTHSVSIQRLQA